MSRGHERLALATESLRRASRSLRELDARAVAVVIAAEHECMATRGVKKRGANTVTTQVVGSWADDPAARAEIMRQLEFH